jgi:hypothetical protein
LPRSRIRPVGRENSDGKNVARAWILGRMTNTIPTGLRQTIAEQAGVVSRR